MKRPQTALLFTIAAFLIGAASNSLGFTKVLADGHRIPAVSYSRVAQTGPRTHASTEVADSASNDHRDLSDGSFEEYEGHVDGPGGQGSGYGDVYDEHGHLLWRFAVLQRSDSKWTIFKYFSQREQERRDLKAGQDPGTEPGSSNHR